MEKIGIIDLGANSARLVIVNLFADGYFMVVDELKESVRLGQDMERDGFLKPQRVAETIKTLRMFKKLCDFTFLPLYYRAMKLLNASKCGMFVKGICRYMLHDELPKFEDKKVEGYFNLCKRQMDMSKQKKKAGSKGGKTKSADKKSEVKLTEDTEEMTPTPQDMLQLTPTEEPTEQTNMPEDMPQLTVVEEQPESTQETEKIPTTPQDMPQITVVENSQSPRKG